MKTLFAIALSCVSALALAGGPGGPGGDPGAGGGGGGFQPGGGGNQPDQPGGGGSFTYDTFLTDSAISGGCIVYGDLMTGYVSGGASVTIPSSVTTIADGALSGNASVVSIDATSATGVTALPDSFASGCESLTNVNIASTVKEIGASAFTMDSELAAFTGPGVATVGDYAFFGCKSLVLDEDCQKLSAGESAFREVSFATDGGDVYRIEAAPLVEWLRNGGTVAAGLAQPASYNTEDLKSWLEDAGNVSAYLYSEEFATNAEFRVLSVSGTSFRFAAPDSATESVVCADLQVSTDLSTWTTVADDDIKDGVYTMNSPTNGFARVIYSTMWW